MTKKAPEAPAVAAPEVVAPEAKTPEQEMFEKVAMMSNLTSAVQNPGLKTAIAALPGGDKIYNLLVKAVHQEIQGIMGRSDKEVKELSVNMQQMAQAMSRFHQIISDWNSTQLVAVLGSLNQKIKPAGDGSQQFNVPQQQQQNSVDALRDSGVSSSEQVYIGPGQRASREPGIGGSW